MTPLAWIALGAVISAAVTLVVVCLVRGGTDDGYDDAYPDLAEMPAPTARRVGPSTYEHVEDWT